MTIFLKSYMRRIFSHATYYIYTLDKRIHNWFLIRIRRQDVKTIYMSKELTQIKEGKFALLALYPANFNIQSSIRLIRLLKKNNYQVICIINWNKLADEFLEIVQKESKYVIVRNNIGRDFGAYRHGISLLFSLIHPGEVESLLLANDSVFYTPKSDLLSNFFKEQGDWKSLYVNFQFDLHAQSFFLEFSKKVISHEHFKRFWRTYYPSSIRHEVINNGELVLSRELLKAGFAPIAFFNSEKLGRSFRKAKPGLDDLYALAEATNMEVLDLFSASRKNVSEFHLALTLDRKNPSHYLGPYCTRYLGAPLKMDLGTTGLFSQKYLLDVLRSTGLPKIEMEYLRDHLTTKGTSSSVRGLNRLWRMYGLMGR